MKKSFMMKLLGIIATLGVTIASTASVYNVYEPKRPNILK